jgi:hypothetical protein
VAEYWCFRFASGSDALAGEDDSVTGPSWKHRRRLIYSSWGLGVLMVVTGGFMFMIDFFSVGVTLITGGVSLISIILTAYTGFATIEDIKLFKDYGEDSDG